MTSDKRAVSEVLGYTLIFTILIASITIVSVGGLNSLETARDAEQLSNAERAFEVLADNTEDIYYRNAPSRATEMSLEDAELFMGENITITVETGSGRLEETTITPLVFRSGNSEIVYEAGAIFRTRRDSGRMIRAPPHVFKANKHILSLVATQSIGQGVAGTDVIARMKARNRSILFGPDEPAFDDVELRIDSPRAPSWFDHLEGHAGTTACSVSNTTVECALTTPTGVKTVFVTVTKLDVELEQ